MEVMDNLLTIAPLVLMVLGLILGLLWLILPFILIKKLNNIDEAVRTFHTDLAQFLNDYVTKTLPR
ncbi:MAG: hypothetical protein PHN52_02770 [candidate division Zixibacteria bacterium]|nr:hypothetical protein [candidate division Zixibacteria bacterium]